jgi:hypothetical protein
MYHRGIKVHAKTVLMAMTVAASNTGYAGAANLPTKAPPAAPPPFFIVNDTQLSYWHEFSSAEPSVGKPVQKETGTIVHFDVWKYGTNFVNIDFIKSNNHDPAAPWGGPGFPIPAAGIGDGAFEVYGLFRSTLSFNALTGSRSFTFGPVKDISLYYGADVNTKNTAFAPQKRLVVGGLQVAFDVPGYFNVAVAVHKEKNHNGIVPLLGFPSGMNENYDLNATATVETMYMQPLAPLLGGIPLRFSGFTNVVAPKGKDGFGNQTKTEILSDNRLTLDLGVLAANKPNWIDLFGGWRYWQNKFGNDHKLDVTGGTTESTAYIGLAWHAL